VSGQIRHEFKGFLTGEPRTIDSELPGIKAPLARIGFKPLLLVDLHRTSNGGSLGMSRDDSVAELELIHAASVDGVRIAQELFREYQRAIDVDLCFQDFERELASLPGDYACPGGRLLLGKVGDEIAGCVALRRLSNTISEIKRLFVRPAFQVRGLGRQLARAIIEEARSIRYKTLRLDTLPKMTEAQALYRSLGFKPIPAYTFNPTPGTLYFELRL